ncbi:hypothetical protein [Massilia endophytica]|uniref:hypothetical protein n=1 Tax=Massilia endophytica TaxID=2899220 RepID=UPI001E4899B6|nr:hypothetical protein [Massilia endophytica]UGQ45402.1 hypothetical protein LSQ66_16615 [Massilia endophytica]
MAQRMLLAWILSFSVSCSLAETRLCSPQEEEQAEYVAATATSWQELYQQFLRYGHCDDGAIAEGFSEAVTVLLAEHWHAVKELDAMRRSDPGFQAFVFRHINETVPPERLNLIARNAHERCPPGLTKLCRDIEETISTLATEAYRLPKNGEGSYCFFDPKLRVSWSLQTFDLHEEQKGPEKIEYVMSASVSADQHCFPSPRQPSRHPLFHIPTTSRTSALG